MQGRLWLAILVLTGSVAAGWAADPAAEGKTSVERDFKAVIEKENQEKAAREARPEMMERSQKSAEVGEKMRPEMGRQVMEPAGEGTVEFKRKK